MRCRLDSNAQTGVVDAVRRARVGLAGPAGIALFGRVGRERVEARPFGRVRRPRLIRVQ